MGLAAPTVALCVLFTFRFESPYILPWIAHHALYGKQVTTFVILYPHKTYVRSTCITIISFLIGGTCTPMHTHMHANTQQA